MMKTRQYTIHLPRYWVLISPLLVVTLLLLTGQPVVYAQAEAGATSTDADYHAADLERLVGYSYFAANPTDNGTVRIEWETSYEAAVAGFNVLAEGESGLTRLNNELILSQSLGLPDVQSYTFEAVTDADTFVIEHITFANEASQTPTFEVGTAVGEQATLQPTDGEAIRAEYDAFEASQRIEGANRVNRALDAIRGPAPAPDEPLVEQTGGTLDEFTTFLPLITDHGDGTQKVEAEATNLAPDARIELRVDKDGIYRVTHQDFLDANIDLTGVTSAYLALTDQGEPVRMRVVAPATSWGPVNGGEPFIEFVGKALDTLYTQTNVYVLQVDRTKAFRVFTNQRAPSMNDAAPEYYMAALHSEENNTYSPDSRVSDPWYHKHVLTDSSSPKTMTFTVRGVDNLVPNVATSTLDAIVWTIKSFSHPVTVSLNGTEVINTSFSGSVEKVLSTTLPNGLLQNGNNSISMTLGAAPTNQLDLLYAEAFDITFPRAFAATDDNLHFSGDSSRYRVDGFQSSEMVAYSQYRNRLWRLDDIVVSGSAGDFAANIAGWGAEADYWVTAATALMTPEIAAAQVPTDITVGTPNFLIISHPLFIPQLDAFVQARTAQGYSILVVNVEDIYENYSYGVFDANAIHAYTQYAINEMGVEYILLVGGDTVAYRDDTPSPTNANPDPDPDISYIPSLYRAGHPDNNFVAMDPLFADSDDDGVPDAALGRFPVRSTAEMTVVINKILAHDARAVQKTAVFAADEADPGLSYGDLSDNFILQYPNDWTTDRAYVDDAGVAPARTVLFNAMNSGYSLINYLGHSGPDRWTFVGLLTQSDLATLTNQGNPFITVQWGCYNSWFQSTTRSSNRLVHNFLTMGDYGAVAAMGSIALTYVSSDVRLSNALTPKLSVPGITIGDALLQAKREVAQTVNPPTGTTPLPDVILGWTLMGDPTMQVR